ncbi:alpha/beta hydrolase [Streptomyces sp. NPDC054961]
MNDVTELKQFVVVHAKAQNIPTERYERVLERITTDEDGAGSWVHEWSRDGDEWERLGKLPEAIRSHAMARFPYVDGPARQRALDRCVELFERWRRTQRGIERVDVELPGGRVGCWAAGLSSTEPRPLLLVSGGIVSIKEQWAPLLALADRLGMAMVVTEMPGAGENTVRYDSESWRILPALLDALAGRARVEETYAVALSFSGHLALRAAGTDPRLRGLVLAGAPVRDFFTDADWQRALPRVTVDTLAHLTGVPAEDLGTELAGWALKDEELAALDIPVASTVSLRDEIIPAGDAERLRANLRSVHLHTYDDVHASPRYVGETRLWNVRSVLRMRGGYGVPHALLDVLLFLLGARRRILGPPR